MKGSLYCGIYKDGKQWGASIFHKGSHHDLGLFQYKKDAEKAIAKLIMENDESETPTENTIIVHEKPITIPEIPILTPEKTTNIEKPKDITAEKTRTSQRKTTPVERTIISKDPPKKKTIQKSMKQVVKPIIEKKKKDVNNDKKSRKSIYQEHKREQLSVREKMSLIMDYQQNLCNGCFTNLFSNVEIDHILPISLGGSNDRRNLQALCPNCHRLKTQMMDPDIQSIVASGYTPNREALMDMQKTLFRRFYRNIYESDDASIKKMVEYRYSTSFLEWYSPLKRIYYAKHHVHSNRSKKSKSISEPIKEKEKEKEEEDEDIWIDISIEEPEPSIEKVL